MKQNTYAVIMAGGIGSRFWPMSTAEHPKQFLDILGTGKTLIQQTVERFKNIVPSENILIVTNVQYKNLVLEQLPQLKEDQVLCEPARRNTAPCIAYAAYKIKKENPEATMVVAPSDHLILDQAEFDRIIDIALNEAKQEQQLVTLGIKPSRPDTGYGYIQFIDDTTSHLPEVKKVKTFTEKPILSIAKEFLTSGDFYWNSGIFIWSAQSIVKEIEIQIPDLASLFEESLPALSTENEAKKMAQIYVQCPNISIDFGVMEKAKKVKVVLADFGWSDLGTWGSLYTHLDKDEHKNATLGKKAFLYDSSNCIVNLPNDKLAVIQGLNDYIIVESDGVLLVCKKDDEQKIKQYVTDLKTRKVLS